MAQYRIITDQSFRSHLTELNVRKICEAKFGRRDDLRRLGISDAVIDGPMFELWMTMRQKFWEFFQQLPDEVKPKAGGQKHRLVNFMRQD